MMKKLNFPTKIFYHFFVCLMAILGSEKLIAQTESPYQNGVLLVQLREKVDAAAFASKYSGFNLHPAKLLSKRMNIWLFEYNDRVVSAGDALLQVRRGNDVLIVQFNHFVSRRNATAATPDDPQFGSQWALNNTGQSGGTPDADIDAPEAWEITTGGTTADGDEIVIAVIDGGVDLNHEDINFWKNNAEIPGNSIDDDGNGYVDDFDGWNAYDSNGNIPSDGHGTHVAGIAAAIGNNGIGVSGVNWGAKVMPVAGASNLESTVIEAYGYVLEMRARYNESGGTAGAFVVSTNASFGVDFGNPANFPLWCAIYDSLGAQGILNCGATANLNIDIDTQGDVPTACASPYMISVTNTTRTDQKNFGAAYGATTIDLGAPGTTILSTWPGNNYTNLTGTSMATPTVAGAIALLFAAADQGLILQYKADPGQTALLFRDFLLDGVDPIPALSGITVTGGRLNVFNSIQLMQGQASAGIAYDNEWNLVGLPLNVSDPFYLNLFPEALENSLFSFDGAYVAEDSLVVGAGYWVRFNNPDTVAMTGSLQTQLTLNLQKGWNLISGVSCDFPAANIADPDSIIIPGTIFGFNGAYFSEDTLARGRGYWIRADTIGTISLDCADVGKLQKSAAPAKAMFAADEIFRESPRLIFKNSGSVEQKLFFNLPQNEDVDLRQFSVPPPAPNAALDARFTGDFRVAPDENALIRLQSSRYPVIIRVENLPQTDESNYSLSEMVNGTVVAEHALSEGRAIEISNPSVTFLQLQKNVVAAAPTRFALAQNYPNPFNPETAISYELPAISDVAIVIYNTLGQKVRTLVSAKQTAGFYNVTWDARNDARELVASGIYLYQITAGKYTAVKKLILLK